MLTTVLLDLDNTLLNIDMSRFMPRFFDALRSHGGDALVDALMAGTRAALTNDHPNETNQAVIERVVAEQTGSAGVNRLDQFYRTVFPTLNNITTPAPDASRAVALCQSLGLQTVIATHPLYPHAGIIERMRWAGVAAFDYALITSSDNTHATKPSLKFYRDILVKVGANGAETVMVGDDWQKDIEPAAALGMKTFWIPTAKRPNAPAPTLPDGCGSLSDFCEWLTLQVYVEGL